MGLLTGQDVQLKSLSDSQHLEATTQTKSTGERRRRRCPETPFLFVSKTKRTPTPLKVGLFRVHSRLTEKTDAHSSHPWCLSPVEALEGLLRNPRGTLFAAFQYAAAAWFRVHRLREKVWRHGVRLKAMVPVCATTGGRDGWDGGAPTVLDV